MFYFYVARVDTWSDKVGHRYSCFIEIVKSDTNTFNKLQIHILYLYSEYKSYNTVVNECKLACKQHQDKEKTSSVVEFLQEYRHYEVAKLELLLFV